MAPKRSKRDVSALSTGALVTTVQRHSSRPDTGFVRQRITGPRATRRVGAAGSRMISAVCLWAGCAAYPTPPQRRAMARMQRWAKIVIFMSHLNGAPLQASRVRLGTRPDRATAAACSLDYCRLAWFVVPVGPGGTHPVRLTIAGLLPGSTLRQYLVSSDRYTLGSARYT